MLLPTSSLCSPYMSVVRPTVLRSLSTSVTRPSISQLPPSKHNFLPCRLSSSRLVPVRAMASAATAVKKNVTSQILPAAEPWRCHFADDPDTPRVYTFFEKATSTWQYVLVDDKSSEAIVIDTVLDYDPASGIISTATADNLLSFIRENNLTVKRILETHAHADHLTAAQYFKQQLGGDVPVCIGSRIGQVQKTFAPIYGFDKPELFANTFDAYLKDDEKLQLGEYEGQVIHLPGHTPDHVGYVFGKAIFTGDSMFNPDVGSARVDFPGGNAQDLYASMQRLLAYPPEFRLFAGHDYPPGRDRCCSATVAEQRERNIHCKAGTESETFINWRRARDSQLGSPRLLHPSLQVNIRAGKLPPADEKGRVWFRTPIKTSMKL